MNLIPKPDALRQLEARIDAATQGADPAPWFDGEGAVDTWGGEPRKHKLQAATKVSALAALLTDNLVAFAEVDGEWQRVPSWGWQFASWSMFQINWPVRLSDDLAHWRGALATHFGRDGFDQWLARYQFASLSPDDLPPPSESPPLYAERRVLPDTGTVTLGECVSWVAWQFALTGPDMMVAVDQGEFGALGEREMREAFERVIAKAKAGSLHLHGRFQAQHRGAKEGSRKLELPDLMDFARFNPIDEGLERGTGYAWDGAALDAVLAQGGGFVDIEVPREQVLSVFPDPRDALRQPPGPDDWLRWNEAVAWLMWKDGDALADARSFHWRGQKDDPAAASLDLCLKAEQHPPLLSMGEAESELLEMLHRTNGAEGEGREHPSAPRDIIDASAWRGGKVRADEAGYALGPLDPFAKPWFYDIQVRFPSPAPDGLARIDPHAAHAINEDKSDADVVAEHIRKNGGTIAAALRQAVPAGTRGRDVRGTHDAIRRSFSHYYKKDGFPKN